MNAGQPDALERAVRALFAGTPISAPRRMGLEIELLPFDAATNAVAGFATQTLPMVRRHAFAHGWRECVSPKGARRFETPAGGALTFEPGGQLEYATPPFTTPSALLTHVRQVIDPLGVAARRAGLELRGCGIDPFNTLDAAPLQVEIPRYRCMDDYFATFGPAGARMMRQTASIQVNVDPGEDPVGCWRLLNALAPVLTAMFANSRAYGGAPTEHASYRAATWRHVDPARTGLAWTPGDPVAGYVAFARAAPAIFPGSGRPRPLADWLAAGPGPAGIETHLSTLFPEVRPRGYFELRSIDALPVDAYAAPVLLLAGLLFEPRAAAEALDMLGLPDPSLLERAGTCGVRDPVLAGRSRSLVELGLAGCERLRPGLIAAADLDAACCFFERFTLRGRCPSDDAAATAATLGVRGNVTE